MWCASLGRSIQKSQLDTAEALRGAGATGCVAANRVIISASISRCGVTAIGAALKSLCAVRKESAADAR